MNQPLEDAATPVVRVFGGIGVDGPDGPTNIGGPRQRRLLALLVARTHSVVGLDWLAENLWNDHDRPDDAASAIRTYMSRLRRSLPDDAREWIETVPSGYRFAAPSDKVEHLSVTDLRNRALLAREHDDPQTALRLLDDALNLSQGTPFRELEDLDWMRAEVEHIELDRLEMQEERWEAALALGRHTQITGELAAFTADHGHRDRAVRQYALALHRSGRTAEALRVIADHRGLLVDGAGLDPSPAVAELERALLSGDSSLDVETVGRPLRGYRLLEKAGTGAFSVVWRGMQPSVDREVAIKQIRSELATRPEFIRRFEAEAHLVARIEHPHIVPLIDYWRDPDSAYLVMRWLSGGTLERRLDHGPLTDAETMKLARQIGEALSAAHSHGVIHRDVKPANILFDDANNAFLGDFGIALEAIDSARPKVALSLGSPVYASPEQIRHERLGPEADLFSLGVVLFECLTGSVPFPDSSSVEQIIDRQLNVVYPSLGDILTDVPATVSQAIARATAKDPADRFPTVNDFLAALERDASRSSEHTTQKPLNAPVGNVENPYVGLRAFDDGDVDRFFGRERLVDELLARLAGTSIDSRCLFVVGPSGSGKSSIVRAGLIPALRSGAAPGSHDWFTTTMVPGADPFESLEAALLRIAVNPPTSLLNQLRDGPRGVLRGLRRCLPDDANRVVVVIDQFEEVFINSSQDDADAFLTALSVAVEDPTTPLRLVVTMRADYYHRPLEHVTFAPVVKRTAIEVTPLAADELERATTVPAEMLGIEFERGLAARIVAEAVGQPSPLPLLQYTLSELFDRRRPDSRTLTTEAYEDIGGISGALSARAERLFAASDEPRRAAIRRMFGRLTSPGERASDVRRRAPVTDLGDEPSMVLVVEQFTVARLLTVDRDVTTREPTVEVAHEALMREWPRLAGWLDDDRDLLRSVESIAIAATIWSDGGRREADLYRGDRLADAVDLRLDHPDRFRPLDHGFIEAAQHQAAVERNADDRRLRRLHRLVTITATALLIALVAGGIAVAQQRRANDHAESAELATLISRAAAQSVDAPEVAVLLALEANRRQPGPETAQAVLNALGSTSISNRIDAFDPLDVDSCSNPIVASDGYSQFGVRDGELIERDLMTGRVIEYGSAPAECVQWMVDESLDVRWASTKDGRRMWFGPADGPWSDERDYDVGTILFKSALSPSGRMFFADLTFDGGDESLVVLDDKTGDIVTTIDEEGSLVGFDVSPDGSLFAVGYGIRNRAGGQGVTIVFDSATGQEEFRVSSSLPATRLVFDVAAGELIAVMVDGSIVTIDIATETVVSEVPTGVSNIVDMELARPDGLLTMVADGQLQLIDRRAGPIGQPTALQDVSEARIRPDGTVLTSSDGWSRLDVIELDGNPLVEQRHQVEPFANVAIAGGRAVAVVEPDGDPIITDLTSGEQTTMQLMTPEGDDFAAVFAAPVGNGIMAIDGQHVIVLWEDGAMVDRIDLDGITLRGTVDGDRFAILGQQSDGTRVANLVRLAPGGIDLILTVPAPEGISVRPSPDGGLFVFGSDGTVNVFDSTGARTDVAVAHGGDALVTAFDHSSGLLAIAAGPLGVTILDLATGNLEPVPGDDFVAGLGFARSGELLIITRVDGSVRIWDMDRRSDSGVIPLGSGAKVLSPLWYDDLTDSMWIATSGDLTRISLDPKRWVQRACEIVERELTADEWRRFVPGDAPAEPACG